MINPQYAYVAGRMAELEAEARTASRAHRQQRWTIPDRAHRRQAVRAASGFRFFGTRSP